MTDQATMEETKHDKFVRIRDMRMPKAVHAIELLGNLGSHHYEFTPEEARALVDELDAAVATVADALGIPHRQVTPSDALPPEASIVADEGAEEGEELPEEGSEPTGRHAASTARTLAIDASASTSARSVARSCRPPYWKSACNPRWTSW